MGYCTQLKAEQLQHLRLLTNLTTLNLYSCSLNDSATQFISNIVSLTSVNLTYAKVSDRALVDLAEANPDLKIIAASSYERLKIKLAVARTLH